MVAGGASGPRPMVGVSSLMQDPVPTVHPGLRLSGICSPKKNDWPGLQSTPPCLRDGWTGQMGRLDHQRNHQSPARPVDVAITHGNLLLGISSCPRNADETYFVGNSLLQRVTGNICKRDIVFTRINATL